MTDKLTVDMTFRTLSIEQLLLRLTAKVELVNNNQYTGMKVRAEDWRELRALTTQARSILGIKVGEISRTGWVFTEATVSQDRENDPTYCWDFVCEFHESELKKQGETDFSNSGGEPNHCGINNCQGKGSTIYYLWDNRVVNLVRLAKALQTQRACDIIRMGEKLTLAGIELTVVTVADTWFTCVSASDNLQLLKDDVRSLQLQGVKFDIVEVVDNLVRFEMEDVKS